MYATNMEQLLTSNSCDRIIALQPSLRQLKPTEVYIYWRIGFKLVESFIEPNECWRDVNWRVYGGSGSDGRNMTTKRSADLAWSPRRTQ